MGGKEFATGIFVSNVSTISLVMVTSIPAAHTLHYLFLLFYDICMYRLSLTQKLTNWA